MSKQLSIDELNSLLSSLESGGAESMSNAELDDAIRRTHDGFMFVAPIYDPGLVIWRMVRVGSLPAHKGRISYPPKELVTVRGRLNETLDPVFYGSLQYIMPCVFEVGMTVGDIYCASMWRSKERIMCSHLGYSKEVLANSVIPRSLPNWAEVRMDTERNELIRKWQARVFTRQVPKGSEHLYRLGLALKRFAIAKIAAATPDGFTAFDGLIYPSIATTLAFDNVALLPSTVDDKFDLVEARLLALVGWTGGSSMNARQESQITMSDYDCAHPNSDGRLQWGAKRTITFDEMIGTTSTPSKDTRIEPLEKRVVFTV